MYKCESGIYQIKNIVNEKVYIGSSKCINRRFNEHQSQLRKGCHTNHHLQNAWNKYGEENFTFQIIETCSEFELTEKEDYWIDCIRSHIRDKGYNLHGVSRNRVTDETRMRLSEVRKGIKLSDTTKKKLSKINTGRRFKLSEEAKEKISKGKKGKIFSESHRRALSESHLNTQWSDSQRKGMLHKQNKKLNYEIAKEIRINYSAGKHTQVELANLYNVSSRTIFDIIHNKYYSEEYYV